MAPEIVMLTWNFLHHMQREVLPPLEAEGHPEAAGHAASAASSRLYARSSRFRLKDTTLSRLSSRRSTTSGTAYANAHHNLAILPERRGDPQGLVRDRGAWRRLTTGSVCSRG